MQIAHERLKGLDRDRVVGAVQPVLRAHGVVAVELAWVSDGRGWKLELSVERPPREGAPADPTGGVTIDLCTEISRDLSAALDVADCMPGKYRLEVGSPGVERALYRPDDYARFSGRPAKIKLTEPIEGQFVLRGPLRGLDDNGHVVIESDWGMETVDPRIIESGHLVFEFGNQGRKSPKRRRRPAERRARNT